MFGIGEVEQFGDPDEGIVDEMEKGFHLLIGKLAGFTAEKFDDGVIPLGFAEDGRHPAVNDHREDLDRGFVLHHRRDGGGDAVVHFKVSVVILPDGLGHDFKGSQVVENGEDRVFAAHNHLVFRFWFLHSVYGSAETVPDSCRRRKDDFL